VRGDIDIWTLIWIKDLGNAGVNAAHDGAAGVADVVAEVRDALSLTSLVISVSSALQAR
jgi:hypothetical protein